MSSVAAILTYSFGSESLDQDPLLIFSGDKVVPIAVRHHFQRHTEETLKRNPYEPDCGELTQNALAA